MENWLKALIGAACAVVIAGGSYFAYGEYSDWRRLKDLAAARAEAEAVAAERDRCTDLDNDRWLYGIGETPNSGRTPERLEMLLTDCVEDGFVDTAEVVVGKRQEAHVSTLPTRDDNTKAGFCRDQQTALDAATRENNAEHIAYFEKQVTACADVLAAE